MIFLVIVRALLIAAVASGPATRPLPAVPARDAIFNAFEQYDLVGVPELHGSKQVHEFLRALIRDPRLVEHHVTNIVVEFGNAKFQDIADRYVFGEEVDHKDLQQIWRDTTIILVWDSPIYEEFFATVRDVNRNLPHEKKIRVILGDPPIDWKNVQTKVDYERFADRDLHFAQVVEQEVLDRKQKALLVCGRMHLINAREISRDIPDNRRSAGDLLHRRHPGKLFAFWDVDSPLDEGKLEVPAAAVVRGSIVEQESFAPFAPTGILVQKKINGELQWVPLSESDWPTVAQMVDGLIYYGNDATLVSAPAAIYRDKSYVAELRLRAKILSDVYGMDFDQRIDAVIPQASDR